MSEFDELHVEARQDHMRAFQDAEGVTYSYAVVHGVYAGGSVNLIRPGNQRPDGSHPPDDIPTPVFEPTMRLSPGDTVLVAHSGGHSMVMGRKRRDGDRDTQDLSDNKLERSGDQNMRGPLRTEVALGGVHREMFAHVPTDGDYIGWYQNTDRSYSVFNQTTQLALLRQYRDGYTEFPSGAVRAPDFHGPTRALEGHEHDHRYYTKAEGDNRYLYISSFNNWIRDQFNWHYHSVDVGGTVYLTSYPII